MDPERNKPDGSVKRLIVLLGPTGVGKTEVSFRLADYYASPIVSSDSRQLYRDIPIGTAAPTRDDLRRIRHYMVGTLELTDYYSASRFEEEVIELLDELYKTHDTLILSGGSMMYIDAVCKGIDEIPTIDEELRNELKELYEREGLDPIRSRLKILDPLFYDQVDLKNPKRVIHALEVCLMTGKPYSSLRTNPARKRRFETIKIGLRRERPELYARINSRVDKMVEEGLLEEAYKVYPLRHLNSLNTVGYKELFRYFDGEWNLDFALEKIRQNSRIYSRKQMTWFKKDPSIHWFHPDEVTGDTVDNL